MILFICFVTAAVKRKYEAVRRQWLEEEKDDQHEIASQRMKKKYASRLQRVYIIVYV